MLNICNYKCIYSQSEAKSQQVLTISEPEGPPATLERSDCGQGLVMAEPDPALRETLSFWAVPLGGIEPSSLASEASALSVELQRLKVGERYGFIH